MGISYTFINLSQMPNVTAARVLVGDANNRLAAVDVTGDITIGNTGITAIGASKVLGSMIPDDAVGYFETATEVEVDHMDASPVQLLASDALNDRLIMIQAIASETATGGPDFDIGSVTAPNGAFDDIGVGVWVAGERWVGYCLLPATEALRCTIAVQGTAGKIKFRSVVLIPKVQTAQVADDAVTSAKLDESTVQYAAVEISSAEVLTLFTAPKVLVAGQAGKILEFISLLLALDWNGVAYTVIGCGNLNVNYVGGATVSTDQAAAFLAAVADDLRTLDKLELTITPAVNAALVLTMGGANPAAGNSPIHAKVAYRVLATGL